jgi:hypothetical protein
VDVRVPIEKLPEPSLATRVEPVLLDVALEVTVNVSAAEPLKDAEPDKPVPDTFIVSVLETCVAVVADVALPLSEALMVPALKLPDPSLATTLDAVFDEVASTAQVCPADPL